MSCVTYRPGLKSKIFGFITKANLKLYKKLFYHVSIPRNCASEHLNDSPPRASVLGNTGLK